MFHVLITNLLLLHLFCAVNSRQIVAYFEGLKCDKYNKDYVQEIECWLGKDGRGQTTMNVYLTLSKDLYKIIDRYRFILFFQNRNDTYLSADIDICAGLGTSFTNPVTRMISEEIHRISNYPYECPLKKGFRYMINNFTINSKLIPSFTPTLKWLSNSEFYVGKTHVLQFDAFGRVDHATRKPKKKI